MRIDGRPTLAHLACVFVATPGLWIGGCLEGGLPQPPPARDPEYRVGFYNSSTQRLDHVRATWDSHGFPWVASAGFLRPNPGGTSGGSTDGFQPDPIPDRVKLSWTTPDGKSHERDMQVASKVPDLQHFSGKIYFNYNGRGEEDGWHVVAVTYADERRLSIDGKPIIPPDLAEGGSDLSRPPTTRAGQEKSKPATQSAPPMRRADPKARAALESLMLLHLASMRAEILPMGDYCQSPDPATQSFIDACSRLSDAAHQLADAVQTKFGKEALGELQLVLPNPATLLKESWPELKESGDPFPAELEHATVEVRGDRATVQMGVEAVEVHKVAGHWKVQIPSLSQLAAGMGLGDNPQAKPDHMARDCEWAAGIDQRLAAEVRAGKFQSAAAVKEARAKRQQEAGELLQKNPDLYLPQQPDGK